MSPHFRAYASNLNRVRLAEMIDHHVTQLRYARARPSLIFNPLSGQAYGAEEARSSAPVQS
jgi:hypothetical protein